MSTASPDLVAGDWVVEDLSALDAFGGGPADFGPEVRPRDVWAERWCRVGVPVAGAVAVAGLVAVLAGAG